MMKQPRELCTDEKLTWSVGTGNQVWSVFCHCMSGNLDALQESISELPELVECQYAYRTPIYFAVRENQVKVAEFLLSKGADPGGLAVNDTLFEIARDRGYREMEELLNRSVHGEKVVAEAGERIAQLIRDHDLAGLIQILDQHPDWIRACDDRSNEPIHWATMTRQPDMIDLLLERGADIEAKRKDGARPLQLFHGDYHFRGWSRVPRDWPHSPHDIVRHLLKRGAYFDMCAACHMGDVERVRQLLGENPGSANQLSDCVTYYAGSGSPINNAAEAGHLEIVQLLLEHGADPNLPEPGIAPKGRALYSAIAERHHEIAELLLKYGSLPNQVVESSADTLSRAISNNDERAIELLCSHGAARGVDLLAYDNDLATAAAVFAANPSLANDVEALANAAGEGNDLFVKLMLRYCPDLPKQLQFPSWLIASKNPETNRLLFEHGMDPNLPDWLGVRPLHMIARRGDVGLAKQFIEHGARLNVRDEDICSSPLGWAAKFGQLEMVEFLLSQGMPPQFPDDPVWARPVEWAKRRQHPAVVELLRKHNPIEVAE